MLVDTHCHLDQFDDAEVVIKAASERGVTCLVVVSEDPESMLRVLKLKQQHPTIVLAGLGLHPVWVVQNPDMVQGALEQLEEVLPQADELGEVGLDHKWATERADQLLQEKVLARQLDLAAAVPSRSICTLDAVCDRPWNGRLLFGATRVSMRKCIGSLNHVSSSGFAMTKGFMCRLAQPC